MATPRGFALTGRFNSFRGRIVTPATVHSPTEGNPLCVGVRSVWDTGASHSLLSKRVAQLLSLKTSGNIKLKTPFGGGYECERSTADVVVVLGAQKITLPVIVADAPHSDPDCDLLLGLDFITLGDFALTHDKEGLCLSFAYPPMGAPVDYAELSEELRPGSVTQTISDLEDESATRYRAALMIRDAITRPATR